MTIDAREAVREFMYQYGGTELTASAVHAYLRDQQELYSYLPDVEEIQACIERMNKLTGEPTSALFHKTLHHEIWKSSGIWEAPPSKWMEGLPFVAVDATPEGSELRVTDLVTVRKR